MPLKALVLFLLSVSSLALYANIDSITVANNLSKLNHYVLKNDTNGLEKLLKDINSQIYLYKRDETIRLLTLTVQEPEQRHEVYNKMIFPLIAKIYREQGNNSLAIEYYLKAYSIIDQQNNATDGIWLLIDIGNIFFAEKEFHQAEIFYSKSEEIAKTISDDYALAVISLNKGIICQKENKFHEALSYYTNSIKLRENIDYAPSNCFIYLKIAELYLKKNELDSVLPYLQKAEYLYKVKGFENNFLHEVPGILNINYYRYYWILGEKVKAYSYLQNAREYFRKNNYSEFLLRSFNDEGNNLYKSKHFKEAISVLENIKPEIFNSGYSDLQKGLLVILAKAYQGAGNYSKSYQYFEEYVGLMDDILNSHARSKLNQVSAISEIHDKNIKLAFIKQQLENEKAKNEMRNRTRNWLLIISGIILLSLIFLLLSFIKLKKRKDKIFKLHKELENTNKVKDRLFSIIGHDLRAPLTSILGLTGLMKMEEINDKDELKTYLNLLDISAKESLELFERLLQWSKLDKNEINYNPTEIDLKELTEKALLMYSPSIEQKQLQVKLNFEGQTAWGDSNITQTILRNLLSNSIKAAGTRGNISISTANNDKQSLIISIQNSGQQFPEEVIKTFNTGQAVDVNKSTGLGLILCKELTQINKGSLTIANALKEGAIVEFSMPLERS
ncbi:MAG: tetratricopeptide repeat-containing sensor histidine kinase [Bacteroidetes bacterium]|nr:tetratricopeptide repeat-containing sensor histidine kinase [Bacteroidota bacterium]